MKNDFAKIISAFANLICIQIALEEPPVIRIPWKQVCLMPYLETGPFENIGVGSVG